MNDRIIRVSADEKQEIQFLWAILSFLFIVLLVYTICTNPNKTLEVIKYVGGPILFGGVLLTGFLVVTNFLLGGSRVYYDGKKFLIDNPISVDTFQSWEIEEVKSVNLAKPARMRIILKNKRKILISIPFWLYLVSEKTDFIRLVEKKYKRGAKEKVNGQIHGNRDVS